MLKFVPDRNYGFVNVNTACFDFLSPTCGVRIYELVAWISGESHRLT